MNLWQIRKDKSMIKIAICDNEYQTAVEIEQWITTISEKRFIEADTDVFSDGEELIHEIERINSYDIIFLDIEMEIMDGIKTAKKIRKIDKNVVIIYVSGYEAYAIETFEVNPFRFIVKPVKKEMFEKIYLAAVERVTLDDAFFQFKYGKSFYKESLEDIIYFESNRRIINIITVHGNFKFYGKLNEVQERVATAKTTFLRIHQSYLVNYKYINRLSYDFVEMRNGVRLSISEEKQKKISDSQQFTCKRKKKKR